MSDHEHDALLAPPEDERELLTGFLEWFRTTLVGKVDDLSTADAVREATPTGMTLLGIVKHLTWVEHLWADHFFLGAERSEVDNSGSFVVTPDDTVESIVAGYHAACAHSDEVYAAAALDDRGVTNHAVFGHVSVRWILIHMIEETARHTGHMDILREKTDGATG